ncbi:hypothetical protein [Dactylosporangium sp. CA-092794]|uniref:hypothetical protein n=1 Tax=Dactylosporangium sp. CA-092794 TaxID=3239929 RepID=UPI003D8D678D
MNGELAQCLAIASHVSMWLADPSGGRSGSDDLSSLPQFADMVAFDSVVGFETWAERLAGDGVDRLWFAVAGPGIADGPAGLPAPVSAAFMGGVPAGLLSTGPAGSRLWQAQWSAGTRVADGAEILVVNYISEPVAIRPVRPGMDAATQALDQTLRRAAQFADRQQLPAWARVFTAADHQPARDLFPASWPDPDGPRLAGMALAAWVFGGMGSWNDLGFADGDVRQEYEQISSDLFEAVMQACVAAVNIDLP